ncbi:lysophospholipid acyltransferase family protein [Marinicella litoralis]|uniref:Acyltransferase-like protein n=1 Tax=Marinicella litoralis TaxID=644220 RepID=A0A4R6XWM7_9GAMM|nr:lysophospholipid acyltransferase family protein [Marinicella litoralis]TDR22557.1 acyltransferase-like protein [Marinicella litoralis]
MNIALKHRIQLTMQKSVALVCFPLLFSMVIIWFKFFKKYQIKDMKAVRQQFKQIKQNNPDGLLVCPNHLTFIDSMILIWAFGSPWSYLRSFRTMCWNLPKASHVKESKLYRAICYLGKCILIEPDTKASKLTMDKASYLLNKGQYVMVFPEGTRSNTGRINTENFIYGVGKLHIDSGLKQLLCVYLRGDAQQTASKMPKQAEQFTVTLKLITAETEQHGRRAMRDVATQMIDSLVAMEAQYQAVQ